MTNLLLGYLCVGITVMVAYAVSERIQAGHYRREHLQIREDDLVYQDLLARLQAGKRNGFVLAGRRDENGGAAENGSDVAHNGSFPGWGAE